MMEAKPVIHLIVAARPNFMKIAPLYHELKAQGWCTPVVVHTGQHYDANMSGDILRDLNMPEPDIHLKVGSGTHAEQTAGVMLAYEKVLQEAPPDMVVVVGDVNSTLACSITAKKLWLPVAHLEAGLRSGDRRMPEEINRIVTDALSDLLWTPSPDGDENLRKEGVSEEKIVRVGNIMMDSYELMRQKIEADSSLNHLGVQQGAYGLVTMHRPSNVDDAKRFTVLVNLLVDISQKLPLVFPVHPRTRQRLESFGLLSILENEGQIQLTEPLAYIPFMNLVQHAKLVMTDSGGIQEETTYLNVPCLTIRENTERPITLQQGTNALVGPENLIANVNKVLQEEWPSGVRPEYWDGRTAARVADSIRKYLKV